MDRTVGITGAAGFVGRALTRRFRDEGAAVVGVDRVAGEGIEGADIREPGDWQGRLHACDIVVHTAALVSQVASRADAWAVNVVGTRRVLDALAPGARLVHFSSTAVYSPHRPEGADELDPVRPTGRAYGDTKIASEHVVLAARAAGADVVVVRPSDVYGPGSRPWTDIPVAALRAGRLVLPAHGRGLVDPIFVDDLVDAVVTVAAASDLPGRVYNLSAGTPVPAAVFFGEYARRLGLRRPMTASTAVATVVAEVLGRAARLRGRPSELGAGAVEMLAKTGWVSPERVRRDLGWTARTPLAEGMRRTVGALRAGVSGDGPS